MFSNCKSESTEFPLVKISSNFIILAIGLKKRTSWSNNNSLIFVNMEEGGVCGLIKLGFTKIAILILN